ncbi:MAG: tRNA (adenosine(37)-N6)-threonylcarbamoyltransferase complex dimerization subunit type 1 TsaB [Deltaproteobacteria bacterium CG_4_10_14_0_2_um_filter_43_8]|nr:MAG: tRNA (adenosine(37)-N6)-threonylcarbamoyltransferase complex dimerization subunit type 1 TsaB [Deltaproteobacteria bacterium CG11_big_fil_rev_8_21_14_0_20_42_23]PJA18730.1 MAG: tRNA (adenosine(37)-N6)-threonylcarbamoyltransferase complex dimerization subunit type 1 TsaB [Deltaproteobacteria bacterium CG_4_10_14_0_2_um_filter_43_8]PJC64396.1 MAG: tRNA (adenosine(37)-N6)-threonylcarbamoyltransferase complex dimerization subunit type 1 TsaB [Deltaproteobacteria bacterium CG_4_9_14_0_2_um_fil
MKVIFVDTSTPHIRLALLDNAQVICEKERTTHNGQTSHVFQFCHELLEQSKWKIEELQGVVVCIGPGSFTGLRIGISFAKTLAFTLNIPICGVSSLDALAAQITLPQEALIVPLIDARRGELYGKIFSFHPHQKREVKEEASVLTPEKWIEKLSAQKENLFLCGNGFYAFKEQFLSQLSLEETDVSSLPPEASVNSFFALAQKKLSNGGEDQNKILPLYIRPSDAEKTLSL